jgi:thioesterase domain-containing protein
VTYRPVSIADTKAGTPNFIGIGIPDLTLRVLDENRQPVSVGDVGELYVGGDGVGLGYLRRPELSAERFIADPLIPHSDERNFYKTGDLVRLWDGDLEFLGRNDMQVQLRGFRVELGEIEAILNAHEAVEGSVVRMREDAPGDQRLVAYYLAKNYLVVENLREHLLKTLPAYMVPSNFLHLDAFPLNNNGKIDVAALPVPMADETTHDMQEDFETDSERKIAEIWRQLLRNDDVRRRDNFFASGGHSLLAIQLLTHINEFFGSTLTLADFFEDPTITGVVGSLFPSQEIKQVQPGCHLRRIREGTRTPIFCLSGAGDLAGTYEYFAEALSEDQPIYGFANLESVDDGSVTIEQLADRCITELRKVQPKGPYYLSGFSLGGVIAFEIARKLIEEGEKVPVLAMIDSSTPDHGFTRPSWSIQYLRGLFERAQARIRFFTRTWKLQLGYLRDGTALLVTNMNPLTRADRFPLGLWDFLRWSWTDSSIQYYYIQGGLINPHIGERRLKLYLDQLVRSSTKSVVSSWKILREYEMVPIPVKVTLLRAQHNPYKSERRDPSLGWSLYALNGVQIIELPGNHMVLIRNPYAFGLGRAIQQAIDEVEASQSLGV